MFTYNAHLKLKYQDQCKESDRLSQNQGPDRIWTIISASKTYGDDLYKQLETELAINPNLIISYHKNCVSGYTSSLSLKKYQACRASDTEPPKKDLSFSFAIQF